MDILSGIPFLVAFSVSAGLQKHYWIDFSETWCGDAHPVGGPPPLI